jgi:hypothetical protein
MIIQKQHGKVEITIRNAFDLVLEYHSNEQTLGTNRWLREIKISRSFVRRMFYHVQSYLCNNKIDIDDNNKEMIIQNFIKEWKKVHNAPSKNK